MIGKLRIPLDLVVSENNNLLWCLLLPWLKDFVLNLKEVVGEFDQRTCDSLIKKLFFYLLRTVLKDI